MKQIIVSTMLLILGIVWNVQPLLSKDLVVATFHYPPFYIVNDPSVQKMHVEGIHVEIIKEIPTRLNVNVQYKECGWAHCLDMMEHGESDYQILINGFSTQIDKAPYKFERLKSTDIAISKKSSFAKQIQVFNQTMEELVTNGTIENVKKRFFEKLEEKNNSNLSIQK